MNIKTFWPLLLVFTLAGIINCNSLNESAEIGNDLYEYLQSGKTNAIASLLDEKALEEASAAEWEQKLTENIEKHGDLKSFHRNSFKMTGDDHDETIYVLDFKVVYEKKTQIEQLTFVKRGEEYKLLHHQVQS